MSTNETNPNRTSHPATPTTAAARPHTTRPAPPPLETHSDQRSGQRTKAPTTMNNPRRATRTNTATKTSHRREQSGTRHRHATRASTHNQHKRHDSRLSRPEHPWGTTPRHTPSPAFRSATKGERIAAFALGGGL